MLKVSIWKCMNFVAEQNTWWGISNSQFSACIWIFKQVGWPCKSIFHRISCTGGSLSWRQLHAGKWKWGWGGGGGGKGKGSIRHIYLGRGQQESRQGAPVRGYTGKIRMYAENLSLWWTIITWCIVLFPVLLWPISAPRLTTLKKFVD